MKKKYVNSVLVVILVLVWGAIIRKHFGASDVDKDVVLNTLMTSHTYSNKTKSKDSFKLELVNLNPFKATSRKRVKKQIVSVNATSNKNRVNGSVKAKVTWPKLSYHGFVKGSDKKTRLAILMVNNRLYRKRENEKINELLVVKAFEDSLILSNKNELLTIKKVHETL